MAGVSDATLLALLHLCMASCLLFLLLSVPPCRGEVRRKNWYIPTRLTARIPCLDTDMLQPGRTLDQEHSSASLYRWVQSDGNIIGSGFYQSLRLLRMPANSSTQFHTLRIECMLYNWATDSTVTSDHEVNFYEGPTVTGSVTVGFRYKKNFTEFVDYLGNVNFAKDWCLRNEMCSQAVVAPVRSPELEYPRLFEAAAAYNRTPLGDLLTVLRKAAVTGEAPDFLFHVNFVLRLKPSNRLPDLCNPQLSLCFKRLMEGRQGALLQFSEAAARTLDSFAEEKATVRKLMTKNQELVDAPADALNFSIRLQSVSLCPPGFGPANLTSMKRAEGSGLTQNGSSALLCISCPPGTHGSNGLSCFAVPNDFYTEGWASVELTPCPDYFVTDSAGARSAIDCSFNGTTPERLVMHAMRSAWREIELVFYGSPPGLIAVLLILYTFFSAYALFWQLHRLVTIWQYKRRRGMSDRLIKRFIAESYLRALRRNEYWTMHAKMNNKEE